MAFKLKSADGTTIQVPDGEYYFNTKARGRRLMLNSLSSDARRVYACLELATMGFQQELAVTMDRGEQRPLTPTDIKQQTGLLKQHVTRGLAELEDAGLALRKTADGGPLLRGRVLIYSWAVPREPKKEIGNRARLPIPAWFPDSWEPIRSYIRRNKYSLIEDEGTARGYFEEVAAAARGYQEAEEVLARALEPVCAQPQSARASSYRKNGKNNLERKEGSSSSAFSVAVVPYQPKADEEDGRSLYDRFKAHYPATRFNEAEAKPSFEGRTLTQQAHILERLEVYLSCPHWKNEGGQYIPQASKWLKVCDADPQAAFSIKKPEAASKKSFTESAMEEAKRRFAKFGRI